VEKEKVGHHKRTRRRKKRIQEYQSQNMYQKKKSRLKSYGMSLNKMIKWHRRSQNRQSVIFHLLSGAYMQNCRTRLSYTSSI
jgi:hypothetical protein